MNKLLLKHDSKPVKTFGSYTAVIKYLQSKGFTTADLDTPELNRYSLHTLSRVEQLFYNLRKI